MCFSANETTGAEINIVKDVINERVNLTLAEVISRIQNALEDASDQSTAIPVKTVCERYLDGTAVSKSQFFQKFCAQLVFIDIFFSCWLEYNLSPNVCCNVSSVFV